MSELAPAAVLCGLGAGLGLWLLASIAPRLNRPTLARRVAPHVVAVSESARELVDRRTADPVPLFAALLGPALRFAHRALSVVVVGAALTERRLRQAGADLGIEGFRTQQLAWSGVGAAAGVVLSLAMGRAQSMPLAAQLSVVGLCTLGGVLGRDAVLRRRAQRRMALLSKELPTVLEFLTLSLSAGEGILDSLRRVARISRGELARELSSVIAEVNTGVPFTDALVRMSTAVELPALDRAVEQITGALERGTPLAEVLRAQAQDARDEAKRGLLELSGKKEVAMLMPLIFLILPITIAFAIFPGIFVLRLGL